MVTLKKTALLVIVGLAILLMPVQAPRAEILATGSPVHGSYGMMFDDDDRLHIASLNGHEIVIMNPDTGEILDRLGLDLGVQFPDDLAIGPDGSVYWTDLVDNQVGRLTPGGDFSAQYVADGINPITFSDDGRLFVRANDHALFEVDPDFIEPPRLIAENIGGINAMDFGPDGLLYFPIPDWGMVVRMDVDSCEGSSDPWNECAIEMLADGFGMLGFPVAVKFNSLGDLYVVTIPGDVFRVDTATGDKELITTGLPIWVDNLAFDSLDRLFVSHSQNGDIWEILPGGDVRTVSPGGMILPGGVAVLPGRDSAESVFVADLWSLREFDGQTGEQLSLVNYSFGFLTPICQPMTVSPDGGNLVLSTWFSGGAVQVYNPQTGEVVESYPDFDGPADAVRFMGDLAVADAMTGSVVRASDMAPYVEGLDLPAGLAASDDDLWVGDYATGMVWQIVADGVTLDEPVLVAEGLLGPEGLAVEGQGRLLVVESQAGRLSRINLATGTVSTVAEGLALGAEGVPLWPPTWQFNGVAVGPSGTIYVTGDVDNVLYHFTPVVHSLDIKPGSCPNSLNRSSHGYVPVGLLGTADFDVSTVDLNSVRISRADCIGGSVTPNEGPPGPHSVYDDVGTPLTGEPCDCHELEGDGYIDLSMKFKTDDLVSTLELDTLNPGELVELVVTGTMVDGCPFLAKDCIRLVPPKSLTKGIK